MLWVRTSNWQALSCARRLVAARSARVFNVRNLGTPEKFNDNGNKRQFIKAVVRPKSLGSQPELHTFAWQSVDSAPSNPSRVTRPALKTVTYDKPFAELDQPCESHAGF